MRRILHLHPVLTLSGVIGAIEVFRDNALAVSASRFRMTVKNKPG
jgi:hypothetical protein